MRAVAYCRVSRDTEEAVNSLNNQINYYTDLFAKKGCQKVPLGIYYQKDGRSEKLDSGLFADEGISGTKLKNRLAFKYLMRCAEDGEFDIVYCKNVQRFARNIVDGQNSLKRLKQLGINVIFEDGPLDYFKDEDTINLFLMMAQSESRMKSGACRFGIRSAQKDGKWTSNCPFGYNRINGYLEINQEETETVKLVYDLYVNKGFGHNRIVKYLMDSKIHTRKGGEWYQQHIKSILTNPIYTGIQITHKSENMDINVKNIKKVDENEWIKHEIESLRIIDINTWQKVQDTFLANSQRYTKLGKRNSDVNVFSTVCVCANCNGIMKRKRKRTKENQKMVYLDTFEWVCQNNDMYGKRKCNFRNAIDENILMQFAKEKIEGFREHKDILNQRLEMYINTYYRLDTVEKIKLLESQLNKWKGDFANKIRLNGEGIISDTELRDFNKEYRNIKNDLEQQLRKFKNLDKEIEEVKRSYNEFVKYLNNVDIENLTNADLKRIFFSMKIGTYEMSEVNWHQFNQYIDINKYRWISKDKETFKDITAEHLFMNMDEGKIIMDALEKSWFDEEIEYKEKYGEYKWEDYR